MWNKGHTEAERSGNADSNFISWIAKIEGVNDTDTEENNSGNGGGSGNEAENSSKSKFVEFNAFILSLMVLIFL